MLKGIDPRLDADLLHALRAMGHGDMLILVDTNFPAVALARETVVGRPLAIPNVGLADAVEAVLSLMPLDTFVDDFAARMEMVDDPQTLAPPQVEVQAVIDHAEGTSRPMVGVERFAFYKMARTAFAIVQTGEPRAYGCVMLRKGVIFGED